MRYVVPMLLLALGACGDEGPKPVIPVAVATIEQVNREISVKLDEQTAAADKLELAKAEALERARFVDVLEEPLNRWLETYAQLIGKKANEVTQARATMLTIRNEMSAAPTTQCTLIARDKIFRGMDEVSAVVAAFADVRGAVPEDLPRRLGEGEFAVREGARELIACKEGR